MDHGIIDSALRSLVGPLPLTLAIVAAYALLVKGVRAQETDREMAGAIFHGVIGLLTIPVVGVLVYLWSFAMDLSLPCGVVVWGAALVSGHACVDVVSEWYGSRAELADVDCAANEI